MNASVTPGRRGVSRGLLALAAAALAAPAIGWGAPAPKRPDWKGVWHPAESNIFDPTAFKDPRNASAGNAADMREFPPYNAEWEAKYVQKLKDNRAGLPTDPTASCVPGGMPRIMTTPYPMEFVIEDDRVVVLHEISSQVRRIWTNGKTKPADFVPSYMGWSTGHWEGDTLVVETTGMRPDTVFDVTAAMHSDQIRSVERITKISPTRMQNVITVYDPVAFTKPWVVTRNYDLKPDWVITEYVCEENNRNPIKEDGTTGFIPPMPEEK